MEKNNYRIGILGGMGPMTGVILQKLIIENTPAQKDQDHIEVICFTNPNIPDRTKSLQEDKGTTFLTAVIESIKVLENAKVNCILIPCNTSHARLADIQKSTQIPVINMIEVTLKKVREFGTKKFGLLATDGTIKSQLFESDKNLQILLPDIMGQKRIMDIIYQIKSGKYHDSQIAQGIDNLAEELTQKGAERIILGCTELSIYLPLLKNKHLIDPLAELAKEAIKMSYNQCGGTHVNNTNEIQRMSIRKIKTEKDRIKVNYEINF